MRRVRLPFPPALLGLASLACQSWGDRIIERDLPEDPEPEALIRDPNAQDPVVSDDAGLPASDPHALHGVSPNHGPFSGGQTVWVRGNGFTSDVRVWFGDALGESTVSVDPNRIQTTTPEGPVGPVDVIVQNGDDESTRRVFANGYEYDPFTVEPAAGPTTGGTLLTLTTRDADWNDETLVWIDLLPCQVETTLARVDGLVELTCRTPEGTPGQKVVTVETEAGARTSVAGAFTYTDYATEFEGGLSGDPLRGELQVVVKSGLTGGAFAGATVILGAGSDERWMALTDDRGMATFRDADLGEGAVGRTATVTALARCTHPMTIADVPVSRATLYLDPILTPNCVPPNFDRPVFGGGAGAAPSHRVSGELVWGEGLELRPGPWFNVGEPRHDDERQVAYVFELSPSADGSFPMPSPFDAIDHDDRGNYGYIFRYDTRTLGNVTLYALAGVEDRSVLPARFTPYAMGMVRGVDATTEPTGLLIQMNITLDHQLALSVEPPVATALGPDRLAIEVALRVGASGYVRLPGLLRQELLPQPSPIAFVGVPALGGQLARAEYLASVAAVTGSDASLPRSHIELLATRQTDAPIEVRDFVPIPSFTAPLAGETWDARELAVELPPGGPFDLLRFDVVLPKMSTSWRIIAPATKQRVELPDLAAYGFPLLAGNVTLGVSAARVEDFDYGVAKERDFSTRGWDAYAVNAQDVVLP